MKPPPSERRRRFFLCDNSVVRMPRFLRDCGNAFCAVAKNCGMFFYPEIVKNAISLCQLKIEFCDALCKRRESSRLFCSPRAARIAAP